jgi:hypothetical protein
MARSRATTSPFVMVPQRPAARELALLLAALRAVPLSRLVAFGTGFATREKSAQRQVNLLSTVVNLG